MLFRSDEANLDDVTPYMTNNRHQRDEDLYHPIVHVEESPKKGMNGLVIGIVSGMFVASIMMMIFAWMMIYNKDKSVPQVTGMVIDQSPQKEDDRLMLESLQKERDTAVAATRAIAQERDAALVAAKAQEQMRAAELRASEILAEQQRKAEARLREARARIRKAENAEAKAIAREQALKLKAHQLATEKEAQRLEALKIERQKLQAERQAELARIKEVQNITEAENVPATVSRAATQEVVKKVIKKVEPKESEAFSTNPCNSPSAKFLSTCKR